MCRTENGGTGATATAPESATAASTKTTAAGARRKVSATAALTLLLSLVSLLPVVVQSVKVVGQHHDHPINDVDSVGVQVDNFYYVTNDVGDQSSSHFENSDVIGEFASCSDSWPRKR